MSLKEYLHCLHHYCKDQHQESWTEMNQISSTGSDSSHSQWVAQSEREVVIPDGNKGREIRLKSTTEKVWQTRKKISERQRERRQKNNSRKFRKDNTIEDLLFSSKNITAMVERKNQFNDLFKMELYADDKYNQLLGDDKRDRGQRPLCECFYEQVFWIFL